MDGCYSEPDTFLLSERRGAANRLTVYIRSPPRSSLTQTALIFRIRALYANIYADVLIESQPHDRRGAIARILRSQSVRKQEDLVRLLKEAGFEVTQSSVSRDLRDMGVLKAAGRYVLPPQEPSRIPGDFAMLAQFVRGLKRAGPSLTVLKTTEGAAQSVAVAIDKADWPEVAGTISGDDTIFIATANSRAQDELLGRLQSIFRVA